MGPQHPTLRIFCLLVALATATAALGQWNDDGNLVCGAANNQESPRLISDGAGGAVIVWEDDRWSADADLYIQRIGAGGLAQWAADGVAVCTATAAQIWPDLSPDGGGGAFLAWSDYRLGGTTYSAYAQHIDGSGAPQWTADGKWVNTGASNAQICATDLGGAYVAWREAATYPASIAVQRLNTFGNQVWGTYVSFGSGDVPRLIADDASGVIVGWNASLIRGQRLNPDGIPQWSDAVVSSGAGCQFEAPLASDGAGGAIWTYEYYGRVIAQLRNSAGTLPWGADGVDCGPSLGTAGSPQVISDGAGGAIVVFVVGSVDIYVNRVLASGSLAWGSGAVAVCTDDAVQLSPHLASDGAGGAFVIWEDYRDEPTNGVDLYAQRVSADGTPQWTVGGAPVCTAAGLQNASRLTATSSGDAIATWQDGRAGGGNLDIYAQIIHGDGTVGDLPFRVTACSPAPTAFDVPWNAAVSATFSEMPAATIDQFVVHGSFSGLHGGRLVIDKLTHTLTLNPADFLPGEFVTVMLTGDITNSGGEFLEPTGWSFTARALGVGGEFLPAVSHAVQVRPMALCTADLDEDGDLDLVAANYDSDTITLRRGNGDGTFAAPLHLATGDNPHGVIAVDLDLDGDLDLVTTDYGSSRVTVFANDGAGNFSVLTTCTVGSGPESVFAADFDGDGFPDLATADLGADKISVLLNTGHGTFAAAVALAAGDNPLFITGADLDGDGATDLVTANLVSDDLSVFLGKGTGMFRTKVDYPAGNGPVAVNCADVDGDGDYDLLVAASQENQIRTLLNQGNGSFVAAANLTTGAAPYSPLAADLDGDGDLDLAHCNANSNNLWVRLNDGAGNFGAQAAYAVSNFPNALVAADLNGDGALDLASANRYGNDITVLLNKDWVSAVDFSAQPGPTRLAAAFPNPFNPSTRIDYTVGRKGPVQLVVFDARGRQVLTLVDGIRPAGTHSVTWNGRDARGNPAASGVYLYRLSCGGETAFGRMALVR